MKRRLLISIMLGALVFGVAAPAFAGPAEAAPVGSHAAAAHVQAHPAAFNRTKFVLHLGVAAFLIHYVYKKYKQGKLGRTHIFTDLKAAAALLFAYHELHAAYNDAQPSNSKTLHALASPINALLSAISSARSKLTHGDTSQISALNTDQGTLS